MTSVPIFRRCLHIPSSSGFPAWTKAFYYHSNCVRKNAIKSQTTNVTQPLLHRQSPGKCIDLDAHRRQQQNLSMNPITSRYFSSRPYPKINRNNGNNNNNNNNNRRKKGKDRGPLVNEKLIHAILRKSNNDSQSTQVRLVIDRGSDVKPDIKLMSLTQAIATTGELGVDLVAINLQQEYPILKAVDYNKLQYEESKKKPMKGNGGKIGAAHVTKEYQFRVSSYFEN